MAATLKFNFKLKFIFDTKVNAASMSISYESKTPSLDINA